MRKDKRRLVDENDKIWSILVREQFNHTCALCNDGKVKPVQAHHIIGRSNYAVRWDLENGVALCFYCHRYRIHGGRLSPEKVITFYERVLGKTGYEALKERAKKIVKFNIAYVIDWNRKLRAKFQDYFGMTWEEYQQLRKTGDLPDSFGSHRSGSETHRKSTQRTKTSNKPKKGKSSKYGHRKAQKSR